MTTPCKFCGKPILFAVHEKIDANGKTTTVRVPLDPAPPVYYVTLDPDGRATKAVRVNGEGIGQPSMVSHFATCRGLANGGTADDPPNRPDGLKS